MKEAIQGMIFVDNSNLQITSINETDVSHWQSVLSSLPLLFFTGSN